MDNQLRYREYILKAYILMTGPQTLVFNSTLKAITAYRKPIKVHQGLAFYHPVWIVMSVMCQKWFWFSKKKSRLLWSLYVVCNDHYFVCCCPIIHNNHITMEISKDAVFFRARTEVCNSDMFICQGNSHANLFIPLDLFSHLFYDFSPDRLNLPAIYNRRLQICKLSTFYSSF